MMTRTELARIGKKAFGKDWVIPMAAALGKHRSNVWRWKVGRTKIQPDDERLIREIGEAAGKK